MAVRKSTISGSILRPVWSISTQAVFYSLFMGRYGELAKPADCNSVTLVVNIADSRRIGKILGNSIAERNCPFFIY